MSQPARPSTSEFGPETLKDEDSDLKPRSANPTPDKKTALESPEAHFGTLGLIIGITLNQSSSNAGGPPVWKARSLFRLYRHRLIGQPAMDRVDIINQRRPLTLNHDRLIKKVHGGPRSLQCVAAHAPPIHEFSLGKQHIHSLRHPGIVAKQFAASGLEISGDGQNVIAGRRSERRILQSNPPVLRIDPQTHGRRTSDQ